MTPYERWRKQERAFKVKAACIRIGGAVAFTLGTTALVFLIARVLRPCPWYVFWGILAPILLIFHLLQKKWINFLCKKTNELRNAYMFQEIRTRLDDE